MQAPSALRSTDALVVALRRRLAGPAAPSEPFGIYVHVPFCLSRCGYCAFTTTAIGTEAGSVGVSGETAMDRWLETVLAEARLARSLLDGAVHPPESIYLGGGTPSLLGPARLARLLDGLRSVLQPADDTEITVEANPDALGEDVLAALVAHGVDRLSIGLQSTSPEVLAVLERTHGPGTALAAVGRAHAAGVPWVGLDLILGTPGETAEAWRRSLDDAVRCGADHISAYALAVEPSTRLAAQVRAGRVPAPVPDEAAERYLVAEEVLSEAGFAWYELSNWARSAGARCRHNLGVWRRSGYWGLGPGAHSHVDGLRWWNHTGTAEWAAAVTDGTVPAAGFEEVDDEGRRLESVMLGIRLADGLDLTASPVVAAGLDSVIRDGLATVVDGRLVLTLSGRLLADEVARRL